MENRAIRANDIPDDDRPDDVVIRDLVAERDSLRDLVRSLRTELDQAHRENKRLSKCIAALETERIDKHADRGRIKEEFLDFDYVVKAPNPTVDEIDRSVVDRWPCDVCGGKQEYVPLTRDSRYHAFAVCKKCGNETEF